MLRIATCSKLPEPDPDEGPLLDALAAEGVEARMAAWDDPEEDWDLPGPTVIRSTWNYIHALESFVAWAARPRPLWNPVEIVRWNVHKGYLAELAGRGHPVVPTVLHRHGSSEEAELGEGPVVIKPAVSAGSFATRRFAAGEHAEARAFLAEMVRARDVLVQPYVPSVEGHGERALVWIDGALTHAVRKSPRFSGDDEAVSATAMPIEADERALAEAVLAPLAAELLYARVDMARDERGRPMLMELELIEPSLFLVQHPPARARLARGIARRLR